MINLFNLIFNLTIVVQYINFLILVTPALKFLSEQQKNLILNGVIK